MSIKTKIFHAAIIITSMAAITVSANDWPNWHGPDRANKSKEAGLLKQWPKEGPKLLWTASGLGEGYSGAVTSGGVVYSAGMKNKKNYVYAFGTGGKLLWETAISGPVWDGSTASWARQYTGSRATPTVSGEMVYHLTDAGMLAALDAKNGAQKWSVSLREAYGAEMPMYGYSESPLVAGNRLYAAAYGKKAGVVCLDKNTGKAIWESAPLDGNAGYVSFVMSEAGGMKQIIGFASEYVYGMDSETGKVLWTGAVKNSHGLHCTDVTLHPGHVFVSSGYGFGSQLLKFGQSGKDITVSQVYKTDLMDNHHGGVILHNGHIYGSGHKSDGWFCLDVMTGKQKWKAAGKGAVTFADGMLYIYEEKGQMRLVKAEPGAFAETGSFQVPDGGKGPFWAHPAVSHGVLYLRHADKLYAYDVKAR
ncbi:MAG: PQQ-like beta-propeller repeat protein [Chitinispirillia bacterium]|nr:PQQ-like beta-propeller repeat protein [Chitinispirillia bacterium]MCL2241865.1 PQQ-like beta-propeller repeat protein [Chitinispirillia bacterium]